MQYEENVYDHCLQVVPSSLAALLLSSPAVHGSKVWCVCVCRYQRRRMYTRIALGKNSAMDVVSGESSGGQGQLLILYPLLFALQILEIYIGGHSLISPPAKR